MSMPRYTGEAVNGRQAEAFALARSQMRFFPMEILCGACGGLGCEHCQPGDECYGEGEFRENRRGGVPGLDATPLNGGPPVEPCDCGWAPHLPVHYRVVLPPSNQ